MSGDLAYLANPRAARHTAADELTAWVGQAMFTADEMDEARNVIAAWPGYEPTPLIELEQEAARLGLATIFYKDESPRFGLKSFKALGGAYAVFRELRDEISRRTGERPGAADMAADRFPDIASGFTVASATAGNHGRSVAWGARMFGCPCVIYIHAGVSDARAKTIESFGAKVIRVDGDYDASVRQAAEDSARNGWNLISDTSYPGYETIPRLVMLGYTVMVAEILDQLRGQRVTHLIVQGGVGGLAAAVAAAIALRLGADRPKIIVVEPRKSDCLYQSALHGEPRRSTGGLGSIMLGLDVGEVSLIAWKLLDRIADAFALISDEAALEAMRQLNRVRTPGGLVEAGECSGAGLALLNALQERPDLAAEAGLDRDSVVLLIGTEGATDAATRNRLLADALPAS